MVAVHGWRECRPALMSTDGSDPRADARMAEIITQVWARTSDADRQAFHRFCCLNRRGADQAVVERISSQINAAMGSGAASGS